MLFAKFITPTGQEVVRLYGSVGQYLIDTFNPDTQVITLIEFKLHGKDYKSKKASLYNLATSWSCADISGISYGELTVITDWFRTNGKRYGMIEEFTENAII